ncbi:MAG TPA: lysylphosphatidylglycerol synthase domain-containing protein, partial [Kofleriaceae bacterium]|nr:lysylphosphatidylglycerol synthase domain-containing protein [Kofleriaceae bacterium]
TWVSLIALRLRWSLRDTLAMRGATYVLALLNYAVGQGGLAYYLHRSGVPTLRAAGMALFMMGTTFAGLILTTTATWPFGPSGQAGGAMWWTLVIGCGGLLVYLVVIALAPRALARRELLAPLFEARIRGHLLTIAGRLPHVVIIVLGHWLAMRVWGFPVPFSLALMTMPAVVIVTALPISPGGLGTTQAALVYFFSDYAPGATDDARAASVFAFAIVHFVYASVWQLLVGLACTPLTRKIQPIRSV